MAACHLPALIDGWHNEGFPTDFDVFLEPEGTLRAVMLFVDFPDAPIDQAEPDAQLFDSYVAPHRAGLDWLRAASHGAVDVELTVVERWHQMSQPSTAYGMDRAITFDQHVAYIAEAVALADADVDFRAYDIVYVVAGRNATGIANSPAYIDASDSHIVADGVVISHGATFGTSVWDWAEADRPLVMAHETAHVFGLPDLYAFSGDTHRFVGGWDVMGDLAGAAPGLFAWHRWKLGWINDRQVACLDAPGQYTVRLTAADRRGGAKLAVIPTGPSTALVLESRRATGLDSTACSTGVLAYRVDSGVATGEGPIRVIDATPGDAASGACRDLDIASFGTASRPRTFTDPSSGVTVEVVRQSRLADVIRVTIPQAAGASCVRYVASIDAPGRDHHNENGEWVRIKNFCGTGKRSVAQCLPGVDVNRMDPATSCEPSPEAKTTLAVGVTTGVLNGRTQHGLAFVGRDAIVMLKK